MENVCRLCAEVKPFQEFIGKITDPELNILQKLIDCCRWNYIEGQNNENLPQSVCASCFLKLNECYNCECRRFSEVVANAQNSVLNKIKSLELERLEMHTKDNIESHSNLQTMQTMQIADEALSNNDSNSKEIFNFELEEKQDFEEILNWIDDWKRNNNYLLESIDTMEQPKVFDLSEKTGTPETRLQLRNFQRIQDTIKLSHMNNNNQNSCTLDERNLNSNQKPQRNSNSENAPIQQEIAAEKVQQKKSIARWLTYTIPDKNFLKLLKDEDRCSDGTVKPERISELKLDTWMIMKYQCWICNNCHPNHHALRIHVATEHPHKNMRNKCFLCTTTKRSYKRPSILAKHIMETHLPHLKHWLVKSLNLVFNIIINWLLYFSVVKNVTHFIGTHKN